MMTTTSGSTRIVCPFIERKTADTIYRLTPVRIVRRFPSMSRALIVLPVFIAAAATLAADSPVALKDVAPPSLKIGVALSQALSDDRDAAGTAIVVRQFNSI